MMVLVFTIIMSPICYSLRKSLKKKGYFYFYFFTTKLLDSSYLLHVTFCSFSAIVVSTSSYSILIHDVQPKVCLAVLILQIISTLVLETYHIGLIYVHLAGNALPDLDSYDDDFYFLENQENNEKELEIQWLVINYLKQSNDQMIKSYAQRFNVPDNSVT
ncbi:hypothetical protein MXB_5381 [Myxobolus squamalis]|nr:hypothetical protein MXB_5381 [Myxobolus squamalis]